MKITLPIDKLRFFNSKGLPHNIFTTYPIGFNVYVKDGENAIGYIKSIIENNKIVGLEFVINKEGSNIVKRNIRGVSIFNKSKQKLKMYDIKYFDYKTRDKKYMSASGESSVRVLESIVCNDQEIIDNIISYIEVPLDNYPSFFSKIYMENVSTSLVQTEDIIVLQEERDENGNIYYIRPQLPDNYSLVLRSLDNTTNFIKVNHVLHEIEWFQDVAIRSKDDDQDADSTQPFQYKIGFVSDDEGVHIDTLGLYLVQDAVVNTSRGKLPGEFNRAKPKIIRIGEFTIEINAIGEDERFRTLFENFGIPDPKDYYNVYSDVSSKEEGIDNIKLNQKSKDMFISYHEIFPFVGTYKALVSAVKKLGYTDIYFREWYKSITDEKTKYYNFIAIDEDGNIKSTSDKHSDINFPMDKFMALKKLNRLTMVYKINKLDGDNTDEIGVPEVVSNISYIDETLIKLHSLRNWLEKNILGLNCKITEITGEGIYFDYYKSSTYGVGYRTTAIDLHKKLTPKFVNETGNTYSSTQLDTESLNAKLNMTLSEYDNLTFEDFLDVSYGDVVKYVVDIAPKVNKETGKVVFSADGSVMTGGILQAEDWEINNLFHVAVSFPLSMPIAVDSLIYKVRNTTQCGTILRAVGNTEFNPTIEDDYYNYYLNNKINDEGKLTIPNPILVNDNTITHYQKENRVSDFKVLPTIKIEKGTLRNLNKPYNKAIEYEIELVFNTETNSYVYRIINNNDEALYSYDYIYLVPNANSSLKYEYIEDYEESMFIMNNFNIYTKFIDGTVEHINYLDDTDFILDISKGSIVFRYDNHYSEELNIETVDLTDDIDLTITYTYTSDTIEPFEVNITDEDLVKIKSILTKYTNDSNDLKIKIASELEAVNAEIELLEANKHTYDIDYIMDNEIKLFVNRDLIINKALTEASILETNAWRLIYDIISNATTLNNISEIEVNHIGDYSLDVTGIDNYGMAFNNKAVKDLTVFKAVPDIVVGTPFDYSGDVNGINVKGLPIESIFMYDTYTMEELNELPGLDEQYINNEDYLNYVNYKNILHKEYTHMDNLRPIFMDASRIYGMNTYTDDHGNKSLVYPDMPYSVKSASENDYCLLSNITEKCVGYDINEEDSYTGIITFYMSNTNEQYMNLYQLGNKLNLYIFDNNKLNIIGGLYNLTVTSFNHMDKDNDRAVIKDATQSPYVICRYTKTYNDDFNLLENTKKNKNLKMFLSVVSEFEVLDYKNNIDDLTCDIAISVNKEEFANKQRFQVGQNIKLSSRQIQKLGKDIDREDWGYDKDTNVNIINDNTINPYSEYYYADTTYRVSDYTIKKDCHVVTIEGIVDEIKCSKVKQEDGTYKFINKAFDNEQIVNLCVTYPNSDFVTYMVVANNDTRNENTLNYIDVLDDFLTLDYIDNTFSMVVNNFDIEDAYRDWLYEKDLIDPNLKYYYDPVVVNWGNQTHITSKYKNHDKVPAYHTMWNIQDDEGLMYTLLNRSIFVKMSSKGIINIDLTAIDEYGNKVIHESTSKIFVN